jgi:hypothetical protein
VLSLARIDEQAVPRNTVLSLSLAGGNGFQLVQIRNIVG